MFGIKVDVVLDPVQISDINVHQYIAVMGGAHCGQSSCML